MQELSEKAKEILGKYPTGVEITTSYCEQCKIYWPKKQKKCTRCNGVFLIELQLIPFQTLLELIKPK